MDFNTWLDSKDVPQELVAELESCHVVKLSEKKSTASASAEANVSPIEKDFATKSPCNRLHQKKAQVSFIHCIFLCHAISSEFQLPLKIIKLIK